MKRHPLPPTGVPAHPVGRLPRLAPLALAAAAVGVVLGTASGEATALSLGRMSVLSALGEPLRAEVSVAEITPAEAETLRIGVASSETFRTAGIAYNAALADVRATLQRRADGRYVVLLTSSRGFTDPFVDLLLEANTGSSRVVRDFTLLLDPPSNRPAPVGPNPPSQAQAQAQTPSVSQKLPAIVQDTQRPAPTIAAPSPRVARTSPSTPVPTTAEPSSATAVPPQLAVRRGDTASGIAEAHRPADISLDQMLVALMSVNPDAFINGNLNRIKAGALISLPNAAQAGSLPPAEARRRVVAQSRDFGDYRRTLAENAPASAVADPGRNASGRLQASVEDRSAAAGSPDKLTIAQGRLGDGQLAQTRQAQDNDTRVAELSKNIGDLSRLQAAGAAASTGLPAVSGVGAGASPAVPAVAGASATSAAPAVESAAPAAPPRTATPATPATVAASAAAMPSAPASAEEESWYAGLLDNPVLLGILSLLVLVSGWLAYRLAGRRRRDAGESVFLDSRLPKDSFFAGSGGESVDTKNRGNSIISSLSYSPGQFDAGDVDPVAEADVYLAYGRDLQAEEILREALRVNPERAAIHLKLLEIHAKRRDLRAYETLAMEVRKLTAGTGPDWTRVAEMGSELDPGNPLYGTGARAVARGADAGTSSASYPTTAPATTSPVVTHASTPPLPLPPAPPPKPHAAPPPAFVPSVMPVDFDLDLDLDPNRPNAQAALDSEWITASLPGRQAPLPASAPKPVAPPAYDSHPPTIREEPRTLPPAPNAPLLPIDLENDFNTEPGALEIPASRESDPVTVRGDLKGDSGFIEFDMSAFAGMRTSGNADTEAGGLETLGTGAGRESESPDAIKLSLARELHALGDTEGARSLVEEVAAESTGELKAQARQLLAKLD